MKQVPAPKFTLPPHVTQRLREQRALQGTPQHFFSSTLETGEFLLTREAGWEPLGQVMGSTVYHIGGQFTNPNWRNSDQRRMQNEGIHFEMTTWTQAFYNARRLAMSRLREEAKLLGASGIVGVRLRHERKKQAEMHLIEFVAMGTAVHERGRMPGPNSEPFLCNLSGDDLWQLTRMGWRAVDVALGACCYYQGTTLKTQNSLWGTRNFEVPELTSGVYTARELAMERLEAEAHSQGASGVIGVEVELDKDAHAYASVMANSSNAQGLLHAVFNFFALGTSIVRAPEGERENQIMPVVEAK